MQNVLETMSCHGLDHDMEMIGHDTPSAEAISLTLKMQQRVLDDLSDVVVFEDTRTSG
jgi:hypothetical protein